MDATLKHAQQLMNEKRWKEAVSELEKLLGSTESPSSELFAALIASLVSTQDTARLQEIIPQARSTYPDDEDVLLEILNYFDSNAMWNDADKVVDKLIELNPEEPQHYFRRGRVRSFQGEPEEKKKAYSRGLELVHHQPFDEFTDFIVREHGLDPASTKTTYAVDKGHNNYGLLFHEAPSGEYITKISEHLKGDKEAEDVFYASVREEFPQLQGITPEFLGVTRKDGIQYLTLTKHTDDKGEVLTMADTIEFSKILTSTRDDGYLEKFPNTPQEMVVNRRGPTLIKIFTEIHTREANDLLLTGLEKFMLREQKRHPKVGNAGLDVVSQLRRLIIGNRLYEFIDPKKHYGLVHPDMGRSNVLISKKEGQKILIDWHSFKSAFHPIDVVFGVYRASYPFNEIHQNITSPDAEEWLEPLEKVFFLYAYISLVLMVRRGRGLGRVLETLVSPALEELEKLVHEVVESQYSASELDFIQQRDEFASQLRTALLDSSSSGSGAKDKSTRAEMQAEINQLKKTLRGMRESKSWKLTKPLRALTGGSGKKN